MNESEISASPSFRYFYTDPLAAMWMAKHFGTKLIAVVHNTFDEAFELDIDIYKWPKFDSDPEPFGWRFYIRPDSLHLLKPMFGDFVHTGFIGFDLTERYEGNLRELKFIQRDDKPFFCPESEAV